MSIENSSWGQQSQPTIWDEQPIWRTAPVMPSVEYTGDTVLAGSLVGEAGHLAIFATSELGNDDYAIKGND